MQVSKCSAGGSRKLTDCLGVTTLPTVKSVSTTVKNNVTKAVVGFCADYLALSKVRICMLFVNHSGIQNCVTSKQGLMLTGLGLGVLFLVCSLVVLS